MNKFQKRVVSMINGAPISEWLGWYKTKKEYMQFHREEVAIYGVSYFSHGLKDKKNRNIKKAVPKNSCELTF